MKRLWQLYLEKMDAATLRERVMIFAATAVALIALMNAALVEPQLASQRKLSRELAERQGEIKLLQEQLQKIALVRQADPDKENRDRLETLKRDRKSVV